MDFGDYPEGNFLFMTNEGDSISKYLSDYLDFVQKNFIATYTFNSNVCQFPPPPAVLDDVVDEQAGMFLLEPCCWENGKRVFTSSFFSPP